MLESGQLYEKSDTFRLISDDLKAVSIPPKAQHKIYVCGNATYKLGVEGELDIYSDDPTRIASVSWLGSWRRVGNKFKVNNVNINYSTTASSFNETGSLGEISVTIMPSADNPSGIIHEQDQLCRNLIPNPVLCI